MPEIVKIMDVMEIIVVAVILTIPIVVDLCLVQGPNILVQLRGVQDIHAVAGIIIKIVENHVLVHVPALLIVTFVLKHVIVVPAVLKLVLV